MSDKTNASVVEERINNVIGNINKNDFKLMFFVVDSKNVPNSSMTYIYQLAYTLSELKYNVEMLYQIESEIDDKEWDKLVKNGLDTEPTNVARRFFGVKSWMGEKFARLPHRNISKGDLEIGAQDFLFIPDAFASLMKETKRLNVPCKRYVILQNYGYVTDCIPVGDSWSSYGIYNAICSTEKQVELIKNVFPYVQTEVLTPYIAKEFRKSDEPKPIVVNVVCKRQEDMERVVKSFYWKYPVYGFVSFRDLRNLSKKEFAKALQEAPITVWMNEETQFGYSALEAIRCGSIVIGLQPKQDLEWMNLTDENGNIIDAGIFTYDINKIPDFLTMVIGSWMRDEVETELKDVIDGMDKVNKLYSYNEWEENVKKLIGKIKTERVDQLENLIITAKNKDKDGE